MNWGLVWRSLLSSPIWASWRGLGPDNGSQYAPDWWSLFDLQMKSVSNCWRNIAPRFQPLSRPLWTCYVKIGRPSNRTLILPRWGPRQKRPAFTRNRKGDGPVTPAKNEQRPLEPRRGKCSLVSNLHRWICTGRTYVLVVGLSVVYDLGDELPADQNVDWLDV